jgi:Ca2+-binding RTX toxin-like protein
LSQSRNRADRENYKKFTMRDAQPKTEESRTMATGPSTSTDPFLIASEPNVHFTSIVTSGDALPSDGVFGGIPDGIGAFDNGDGTITVLVNHELTNAQGIVRDHGSVGAYIDVLTIDKATLQVTAADDAIQHVFLWNGSGYTESTVTFSRFCSGDLPATSALYNSATGAGTQQHIYLTGEENGFEGKPTATIVDGAGAGNTYELASLGNMAFENVVANPTEQQKTVVALTDDGTNGQVYIYVGEKSTSGDVIQQAGLSGGSFFGIKVTGITDEQNGAAANGNFTLEAINGGDVSALSGAQIDAQSELAGVTSFLRPEDFSWDPQNPNVAYFNATNSFDGTSRIYQLTFTDISHPELGGSIQAVVESSDYGAHMFDNLTVNDGKVIVQEDPGGNNYVARVWEYDIATGGFHEIATFNPDQFAPGASNFITNDEESSGVVDVTNLLGDDDTRAYLLDAQVHKATGDPATVEQGQLMVMYVDDPFLIGGNANDHLFGSYADETLRGNNGNDTARAGSGNDSIYGGNGDDVLGGDSGNDQLFGDNGNDRLYGGAGDDTQTGGRGADQFVVDNTTDSGHDVITDFAQGDQLLLTQSIGSGTINIGSELDLLGASTLEINNGDNDVTALKSQGAVEINGTTYYVYVSATPGNSAHGQSAAMTSSLDLLQTHHAVHDHLI